MSMPPDPDDERPEVPPPSPDDRLWRHPSELGAGAPKPATWREPPPRRRDGRTILLGALAGACLAGGTVFVSMWAVRPTRPAPLPTQAVAVQPIATTVASSVPAEQLAHDLGPSLSGVRARHDDIWTTGTGIWLDAKGTLLTAAPLVLGATEVLVTGQDDVPRKARILGTDAATGVTALSVGRTSGVPLIATAGPARSGTPVAVLGAPASVEGAHASDATAALATVRTASLRASLPTGVMHDAIQLDRAVPPDALGGLMVDAQGRVVGITIAATDPTGMGTGSPADWAISAGNELRSHGQVTRAWLGVEATDLDPDAAASSGGGAQLTFVTPQSPAASGGLRAGDVITAVDGQLIAGATDLVLSMRQRQPGDRCLLRVERSGRSTNATVDLGR